MSEAEAAVEADERSRELAPESDPDAAVNVLTHGDPLRSWARLLDAVDEEVRVTFEEERIHSRFIDPSNVMMLDLTAPAVGFEDYEATREVSLGLNLDTFKPAARWARKRSGDGDPVALSVYTNPLRLRVQIVREDQQMERQTEWFALDPEDLRKNPDKPDLDLPLKAYPGVDALHDAVSALAGSHDYAHVTEEAGALVLASQAGGNTTPTGDGPEDAVRMPNAVEQVGEGAASSMFSLDYLRDITQALKQSKADHVVVRWGEEFPVRIGFQHEDWGFNGEYLLAPRLKPDEEGDE